MNKKQDLIKEFDQLQAKTEAELAIFWQANEVHGVQGTLDKTTTLIPSLK